MWCATGLDPERFWDLCLLEISRELDAAAERRRRDLNDRAWLAWHIAALPLFKKFPKLNQLMVQDVDQARKIPTNEQQATALKRWAAGGKRRH